MMPTLTGILLDVSGSMRRSIGGPVDQRGGSWARSIFRVVDQLIKNDVSPENRVFAIGIGASSKHCVFDLLNTIRRISEETGSDHHFTKTEMLEDSLSILEINGAPYVRKWATLDILDEAVSVREAKMISTMLVGESNFTTEFVQKCLPIECRERGTSLGASVAEHRSLAKSIPFAGERVHGYIEGRAQRATKTEIRKAVDKGMALIPRSGCFIQRIFPVGVSSDAIFSVQEASKILRGSVETENLTKEQVDKLMKDVEPYIYGGTPMIEALREAEELMSIRQYQHHKKVLFVLSDGEPTDGDTPPDLSHLNVHVVSCYITDSNISDPKHLYSSKCQEWDRRARFMFDLSSSVTNQQLPRTIFVKRGWKIDFENNETKLFLQVNHPDLIDEVCDFARDVVCCQDTLSDLLASVDLDLYINKANEGFEAKEQIGGTCYANASAAVLHLAMHRIIGRDGGYPDFFALRKELIDRYGVDGANTLQVLQEVCPKYRLHCHEVDVMGALQAVTYKRPVIVGFRLTDAEWEQFSKFYRLKPLGTLSKKDLDITKRSAGTSTGGHSVVLTSFNSKGLTLMNSWGSQWANNGFFSVENANVLGLKFVDVYWTLNDLHPSEIRAYEQEGPRISQKLMASLKGLQLAKYKCPICNQESFVREFTGRLVQATCPKCHCEFNTNTEEAQDLVLNMYLTSLANED